MRKVTSESPDRKKRIVIDPSSETVTFIKCYVPPATSFFTLRIRRPAEFVCPFTDILSVYKMPHVKSDWIERPPTCYQIVTAGGNATFSENWSNFDEAINALRACFRSASMLRLAQMRIISSDIC